VSTADHSRSSRATWQCAVVHLRYLSSADRLRLIATFFPRLMAGERRWFFVDVPPALEVGLVHQRTDTAARADLAVWLDSCQAAGVVCAANEVAAPVALDPRLFFGERAPAFYMTTLAIGSARATHVLRELLDAGASCAPDQVVMREVDALYASLLPRLTERRRALHHYVTWLDQLAPPDAGSSHNPNDWIEAAPLCTVDDAYARLRRSMRAQTARLAARISVSAAADVAHTRAMVTNALVARLAHIQVLRLRGPDHMPDLGWEASLARRLWRAAPETG
jgi:hypothetical protein